MSFLNDEEQSAMEAELLSGNDQEEVTTSPVSDQGVKSGSVADDDTTTQATEDTTSTSAPEEAAPADEESSAAEFSTTAPDDPGPQGWVPRSRLKREAKRARDKDQQIEQLQKQLADFTKPPDLIDQLKQAGLFQEKGTSSELDDILEGPNNDLRREFESKYQGQADQIQSLIDQQNDYMVNQQVEEWQSEIDESRQHFADPTHGGIDIPEDLLWNAVIQSEGASHPHEIAERYAKWITGERESAVTAYRAKQTTEASATGGGPAATPRGSGSSIPSPTRTQTRDADEEPRSVEEAHKLAMAAFARGEL